MKSKLALAVLIASVCVPALAVKWKESSITFPYATIGYAYRVCLSSYVVSTGSAPLRFTARDLPKWISLTADGCLKGTPYYEDHGISRPEIRVEQGTDSAITRAYLFVHNDD